MAALPAGDRPRCTRCGSTFPQHTCTAPPTDGPLCRCGHQVGSHYRTATDRSTYCTAWTPVQCACVRYTP